MSWPKTFRQANSSSTRMDVWRRFLSRVPFRVSLRMMSTKVPAYILSFSTPVILKWTPLCSLLFVQMQLEKSFLQFCVFAVSTREIVRKSFVTAGRELMRSNECLLRVADWFHGLCNLFNTINIRGNCFFKDHSQILLVLRRTVSSNYIQ